jgi:hypothetical protein
LGILASRFVSRPAPVVENATVSPENSPKMDPEMDQAEEEFRKLPGN